MGNTTSKSTAPEIDSISILTQDDFEGLEFSGAVTDAILDDPHRVDHEQAAIARRSALCRICLNVLNDTSEYASTKYHSSLASLERSASSGCHLCSLVLHFLPARPAYQLDEFLTLFLRQDGNLLMAGWRHQVVPFNLVRQVDLTKFEQRYYKELESESQSTFDRYQSFATHMLQDCINHHPRCRNEAESGWSPTRLIEIGNVSGSTKLRLITGKLHEPYIALSHCWGKIHAFKLLAENLESMKVGIDASLLPKTFRDAITIATWMNVRYIWIDSCCIIQDSHEDWLEESAMMDNVYRNAHCTIAADCAVDSNAGCIVNQNHLVVRPCTVFNEGVPVMCLPPEALLQQHFERQPLEQRAWALQERILSPRILHCTSDQLFWECNVGFKSQTYPDNLQGKGDFLKVPRMMTTSFRHKNLHFKWNGVIEDYCKRSLTREEDKLVALSGVAKAFQSHLSSDVYLAGLWYKSMPHCLLWKVVDPELVTRPSFYRAPSWSWAALDGRIIPNNEETKMDTSQIYLDVLSCDVNLASEDSTGQVRGATLEVYGLMKRALWCKSSQDLVLGEEPLESGGEIQESPLRTSGFSFFPDTKMTATYLESKDIYCLLIQSQSARIVGLVVCSTNDPGSFIRLGVFQVKGAAACTAIKYNRRSHAYEEPLGWSTDDDSVTEDSSSFNDSKISAINIAYPSKKATFKTLREHEVRADMKFSEGSQWNRDYENTLPRQRLLESGIWSPDNTFLQRPSAAFGTTWLASGIGSTRHGMGAIETPWRPMGNEIPIQVANSRKSKAKAIHAVYQGRMTDPLNIYLLDPLYATEQFERLKPRTITLI